MDARLSYYISESISSISYVILGFFAGMIQGVSNYFIDAWNIIVTLFTNIGKIKNTAIAFFNEIINDVGGFISSMIKALVDMFVNALRSAFELGVIVGNFIIEKVVEVFTGGIA